MTPKSNGSAREDRTGAATEAEYYVLGGSRVGSAVARTLQTDGHDVCLIDESHDPSEVPGLRGDPTDVRTLEEAGMSEASTVVVATPRDRRNLLVAQLVCAHFDVPRVVVLANAPDRLSAIAAAGHEPICATTALSDALVDAV